MKLTQQLLSISEDTKKPLKYEDPKGFGRKLFNKMLGIPSGPYKYRVGDTVEYVMEPEQEGGTGKGKITKLLDGHHYLVNGKPVNQNEIKKLVKENVSLDEDTISSEAITTINALLAEGKITGFKPPFSVSGNWVNDSKGKGVCEMGESRAALKDIAAALNAFVKSDLKESALHDLHNELPGKTADKLDIGDVVVISGNVQYKDQVGEIEAFGKDKKFVVVKLYGGKGTHSFHSSDVSEEDTSHEDDDEDEEINKFYVAFYENDEERPWIGMVSREGGGKWHEKHYKGKADHRWGQTYMSYLEPADIMSWIHKDYGRHIDIEGPFLTSQDAEDHVSENWGKITESVSVKALDEKITYTDFDDWKAAVLNSYPAQAKKIKFKGRFEGGIHTVSAEISGEDRSYGVWDGDKDKGTVLSEAENTVADLTSKLTKVLRGLGYKLDSKESTPGQSKTWWIHVDKKHPLSIPDFAKALSAVDPSVKALTRFDEVAGSLLNATYQDDDTAGQVYVAIFKKKKPGAQAKRDYDNGLDPDARFESVVTEAAKDMIEAYGVKGMKSVKWRRTFKDADALNDWCEKNDAMVEGQRDTDYAEQLKKDLKEAFKLKDKVKIVKGPKDVIGKIGFIGEIRNGVGGKKYTIDYDQDPKTSHSKSIMLTAADIRAAKD